MNLLQRFERMVQRSMERPFTRLLGSKLQPVEVARVLQKEMVANRRVSIERVYAPNWYHAELATRDFQQFEPFLLQLQGEIASDLIHQAQRRGFAFVGDMTVELVANGSLRSGDILATAEIRDRHAPASGVSPVEPADEPRTSVFPVIEARSTAPAVEAVTVLVRDERGTVQRVTMAGEQLRLGRGLDNDVVLDGLSVSRDHARLVQEEGLYIEDVGSRNGTWVNGERVQRRRVGPGDVVRLGTAELRIEP